MKGKAKVKSQKSKGKSKNCYVARLAAACDATLLTFDLLFASPFHET
jgi:hypothetical protein